MLMLMPAAAFGIERRRFAGDAWMTVVGGAPMMSNVPVRIAVIEEAMDASWQTGDLNDLSASRGAQMINVAMNGRTNVVMTVTQRSPRRRSSPRVTNAVTGVRRFSRGVRVSHSGIVPSTNREGEASAATPPAPMIWFGGAMQHLHSPGSRTTDPSHLVHSGDAKCRQVSAIASRCQGLRRWWRRSLWARLGQITGGSVHQGIALQTAAAETTDLDTLIEGCSDLGEPPLAAGSGWGHGSSQSRRGGPLGRG